MTMALVDLQSLLKKNTVRTRDAALIVSKLESLIFSGPEHLQIICDFDYTLTKYSDGTGVRCMTTHSLFTKQTKHIQSDLGDKLVALYNKYQPIEFHDEMTVAERMPYMVEWWTKAHDLIANSGFSLDTLESFLKHARIYLRDGAEAFLRLVDEKNVPFVLFSAGIADLIELFLKHHLGSIPNNIHIVSNQMKFDENMIIVGFHDPIIHTFNKNGSVIGMERNFKYHLADRHNVILLGDSIGDVHMDVGVENEGTALKIGFLNDKIETLLPKYLDIYDMVLVDDQTLDVPLAILSSICMGKETKNV